MLRYQASLPRLPVPTLASTASKYLETVKPVVSSSAYARTEALVNEFVKSPQAAELQKRLEGRAGEKDVKNWLSEWWNDAAYMGYRDPVVVFVSYFFVHVDDVLRKDQVSRAASLIKAAIPFRDMVESKQLEPEKVRGAPLCMNSYQWLFHSSRYPVKPSDSAKKYDAATHNHVVFARKNKFFSVPLSSPSGKPLSLAQLEHQISCVIAQAGSDLAPPVGVLTADNRDHWTDAREALLQASSKNQQSLEKIESSMIVVCLDDTKPVSREAISSACWTGNGRNRFFDKQQLLVFENGRSGFLGEHSCMDGTTTLRLNEFICATIANNKVDFGTETETSDLPAPEELKFDINDKVARLIKGAEERFDQLVGSHDLQVLHYEGYGKNLIKKFKVSPDAWAQLVKQLAFHKLTGRPAVTYESAQTRKYQLGRTEVIRSASNESKAWTEAMADPKATDARRASLFRAAVARHVQYSAWAADGQGVDRHFFGLKKMVREGEQVPEIYKDESFSKSAHWELSTSQLSSPYLDGWGYGEVVPDGYGLSYAIGDDYIRWTITSLKDDVSDLKHYIAEAAREVRVALENAEKEATKAAKL